MIHGIGIDIVEIDRIEQAYRQLGERFVKRLLTQEEQSVFNQRVEKKFSRGLSFLATRFAAKEAFAKAMGCGVGETLGFQSLAILNNQEGAPYCCFFGQLEQNMLREQLKAKISLADEVHYAIADVVIYRDSHQ